MKTCDGSLAKTHPDASASYTITADYVFGQALLKYAKVAGEKKGSTFLGTLRIHLESGGTARSLTQAVTRKADVLCLLNATDAVTCLRQFAGLSVKDMLVVAPWSIRGGPVPRDTRGHAGRAHSQNYFHSLDTRPTGIRQAYREKYQIHLPATPPAYGYNSFRTVLMAMGKAEQLTYRP